jgi:hypothetical protein
MEMLDWSCDQWTSATVTEKMNILEKMKRKKAKWIGHILHVQNVLMKER